MHFQQNIPKTRKHSSRMCTANFPTICVVMASTAVGISDAMSGGVDIHTHPPQHLPGIPQVPCQGCVGIQTHPNPLCYTQPNPPLVNLPQPFWYTNPLVYPTPSTYKRPGTRHAHLWIGHGTCHTHPRRDLGPGMHTPCIEWQTPMKTLPPRNIVGRQ